MDAGRFQWDARKSLANLRSHGVAFEKAIKAFRDPFAIEWIDHREDYGEERVGMCEGILLHVTYTERPHSDHLGQAGGTT